MKTIRYTLYALTALAVAGLILLPFTLFVGCSTVDSSADAAVVRAEQTVKSATDILDTFLKMEYSNRAFYESVAPEIHAYAQVVRRDGPGYIESARALTKAYKTNRTADGKDAMVTAMAVIESMLTEASKHLVRVQTIRAQSALGTNLNSTVITPPGPVAQTNYPVIVPPYTTNLLDLPGNTTNCTTNCTIPANPDWVSPIKK